MSQVFVCVCVCVCVQPIKLRFPFQFYGNTVRLVAVSASGHFDLHRIAFSTKLLLVLVHTLQLHASSLSRQA